ncbi:MAG: transposase [Patescibacteria group bacterium]|nr:transposase [Patescibacteria group bacterium]
MRKNVLADGEVYHIFTRSIADYRVFNNDSDFERMRQLIKYFKVENDVKFSDFLDLKLVQKEGLINACNIIAKDKTNLVQIIAYCFMPTHIHLVIKQLEENGISKYMKDILISYTRYFNTLRKRKGPLWESRFKSVLVESDDQLQHLIRYIHLNATTAHLVNKPEDWRFSSYKEYLSEITDAAVICQFNNILEIKPSLYRKFVNDQISYQRELAKIKKLIME